MRKVIQILAIAALAVASLVAPASAGGAVSAAADGCEDRWKVTGQSGNYASYGEARYAWWNGAGTYYAACVREAKAYDALPFDRYGAVVEARWQYTPGGPIFSALIAHVSADDDDHVWRDWDWSDVFQVHFRTCNMHDARWEEKQWYGYYGTCGPDMRG